MCLTIIKQCVLLLGMDIQSYIDSKNLTFEKMAAEIGNVTGAGVRYWALGARMPSPEFVERIVEITEGAVSVQDMHETRLAFVRSNPKINEATT
jgi:hypothetical protein